jgi:putative transposase
METDVQHSLTRDEMERRRLAAAQDLLKGCPQSWVARKFGVSRTTASRWYRALSSSGLESLRKRKAPGRPNRLSTQQLEELVEMFFAGPRSVGFQVDRWTGSRLREAIQVRFGVQYDPDHVGRLMHRLGMARTAVPVGSVATAATQYASAAFAGAEIAPTIA